MRLDESPISRFIPFRQQYPASRGQSGFQDPSQVLTNTFQQSELHDSLNFTQRNNYFTDKQQPYPPSVHLVSPR